MANIITYSFALSSFENYLNGAYLDIYLVVITNYRKLKNLIP